MFAGRNIEAVNCLIAEFDQSVLTDVTESFVPIRESKFVC